jgi:hypothetical protein
MNTEDLKDTIKRELPNWLREDPAFRAYVMELTRGEFADRRETSDRYDILGELRRDRERQDQKWAENNRKWDDNQAVLAAMREEDARNWEQNRIERERKFEEDARKWDENQAELKRLHEQFMERNRLPPPTIERCRGTICSGGG